MPENTDCHYANVMNILLGETLHFLTALQQIRDHGKPCWSLKKSSTRTLPRTALRLHPLAARNNFRAASVEGSLRFFRQREGKAAGTLQNQHAIPVGKNLYRSRMASR